MTVNPDAGEDNIENGITAFQQYTVFRMEYILPAEKYQEDMAVP